MDKTERDAGLDAVRGLAISLVLAFHFMPETVPLGYLGVDLFFALSGYFIASQLLVEKKQVHPYLVRRLWRLWPASLLVMATCLTAGYFLMTPDELALLSLDALPGPLFLSNWFGPGEGYFATEDAEMPFLHLWSLGVEAQVYVAAAALVLLLGRGRLAIVGFTLAGVLSFAGWVFAEEAFYETHLRLWQFAAGGALAWLPRKSAAGMLWIGAGIVCLSIMPEDSQGRAAIFFAVTGYMMTRSEVGLLLRPIAWLGRRSYGIYLWHWPLIVFAGLLLPNGLSAWEKAGILILSFVMGEMSWRLVEQQRRGGYWGWISAGMGALTITMAAFVMAASFGLPQRVPEASRHLLVSSDFSAGGGPRCNHLVDNRRGTIEHCVRGEGGARQILAVMGDSHGAMLAPALARAGARVHDFALSGCPLSTRIYTVDEGFGCAAENRRALAQIEAASEISEVVLYSRWSRYTEERFVHPDGAQDRKDRPDLAGEENASAAYRAGLAEIVEDLRGMGKRVTVVYQTPIFGFDPRREALRDLVVKGDWEGRRSIDRELLDGRFAEMRGIVAALPADRFIDPMDLFCDAGNCFAASLARDEIWFADQDHLSRKGADRLADAILAK